MEEPDAEQKHARDYLLGYLDEGERRVVEERLITDPDYLEEVLITESELIEEYLDGMLPERDKEGFIKHILTTERQVEKLTVAKALAISTGVEAAANSPPTAKRTTHPFLLKRWVSDLFHTKSWAVRISLAAIIPIIFFGVLVVISQLNRGNERESLEQDVAKLNAQEHLDAQAIFHGFIIGPLKAGLFRDEEGINKVTIPETENIVQLRLQIGTGDYQSFQAILQTYEDQEILSLGNLKDKRINGERLVIIYLPAKILSPGDYQLRLSGLTQNNQLEYLGRYTFRILGK